MTARPLTFVLAALAGATGWFVLSTVVMDTFPDTVIIAGASAVALAVVLAFGGFRDLPRMRGLDRRDALLAAAGGALAFWATPLLVISQRATDAPSGSEMLFFTTTAWGLIAVAASYLISAERPPLAALAGAVCAAAGAAGLLASWEYPSSFSPFAKFPLREALILVAGMLFAAGALALARAVRRIGAGPVSVLAVGAAAVLGIASALPSVPAAVSAVQVDWLPLVYLGVAEAVFAIGLVRALDAVGIARASSALLGVPLAVTALAAVEQATAVYGPSPFAWPGVLAGSAVLVVGAVVVWLSERSLAEAPRDRRAFWPPLAAAVAACALAVASLATPALRALAEGSFGVPFRAAWTMVGAESAAGWLVLAAALLSLAAVIDARAGAFARVWRSAAAATLVCVVAMVPLLDTTIHTWNQWVPAEVQQTYGTEYARFATESVVDPVRLAAAAASVLAAGLLVLVMARVRNDDRTQQEVRQ